VFVVDRATGTTTRVGSSADSDPWDRSEASSVDARGRVVGFRSYAVGLVGHDSNGLADVFAYDRRARVTQRVNVSTVGDEADAATFRGMVSGNGRFVGFRSRANNLVPDDTNDALDVFVHDRLLGLTTRVSVSSSGLQANAAGLARSFRGSMFMSRPFLSANGRYAAFTSRAANLVADDTNGKSDVFVHDLWTGRTLRVSLTSSGLEANGDSFVSGISARRPRRRVHVTCGQPRPWRHQRPSGCVRRLAAARGDFSLSQPPVVTVAPRQRAVSSRPVSPRKANSIRSTMVRRWWGGRVACECRSQHPHVAAMGLELQELEARDDEMGIGVRWERGEKRDGFTREGFRLVPTSGLGTGLDGDGDRGVPVVRRSGYLLLRTSG
jgi:hypothetical protein